MFIQLTKEAYNSLSESEKAIIDYINRNTDTIMDTSITTIARKTFTSASTVSRAIRKCGFRSMTDLRYAVIEKAEINKKERVSYILNNSLAKSYRECKETIDHLQVADIMKAIQYIEDAHRIFIISRGFTTLVADEFQMYLQIFGYDTTIIKDVMWIKNIAEFVTEDDTVIILTIRNTTAELFESATIIKAIGAKLITCCCKENTNLEKISDVTLLGHSEIITRARGLIMYSRIPLFVITRSIIEYLSH